MESTRVIEPMEGIREVKLTIETNHGTIWAKLFADRAPKTVANFPSKNVSRIPHRFLGFPISSYKFTPPSLA